MGVCPDSGKRMGGAALGIVPNRAKGDMVAEMGVLARNAPKETGVRWLMT